MADKKISGLTAATPSTGGLVEIVQAGDNFKMTVTAAGAAIAEAATAAAQRTAMGVPSSVDALASIPASVVAAGYMCVEADSLALANNANVATWANAFNGANPMIQVAAGDGATYHSSGGANNLPYVSFDGSAERLSETAAGQVLDSWSMFLVAKVNSDPDNYGFVCASNNVFTGFGLVEKAQGGTGGLILMHRNPFTNFNVFGLSSSWRLIEAHYSRGRGIAYENADAKYCQASSGLSDTYPLMMGGKSDGSANMVAFDLAAAVVTNRRMTEREAYAVRTYLKTKYAITINEANFPQAPRLAIIGDSQSDLSAAYSDWWNKYFRRDTAASWLSNGKSVSGRPLSTVASSFVVDAGYFASPDASQNLLWIFAGTNDCVAGTSAATMYASFKSACIQGKAAGYKVGFITIPPRSSFSGANITEQLAFNALVRQNYAGWCDFIVDVEVQCGWVDYTAFTPYTGDGTHLNDDGSRLLGTAALNSYLAYITGSTGRLGDKKYKVYAAGTAYSLTNTAAALDFGTTDPAIVIANAGTYFIRARVNLKYNAATFAANQAVTLKLRRTNNTAADLTGSSTVLTVAIVTTLTGTFAVVDLPEVEYTTENADDAITIFADVATAPGAGSLDAIEAHIIAERKDS